MSLCKGRHVKYLVSHTAQIPQVIKHEIQETRDNSIGLFWLGTSRVKVTVENSILTEIRPSLEGSATFTTSSTGHQH